MRGARGVGWHGGWELRLSHGDIEDALEEELDLLTAVRACDRGGVKLGAAGDGAGVEDFEASLTANVCQGYFAIGTGNGLGAGRDRLAGAAGGREVDDDDGGDNR